MGGRAGHTETKQMQTEGLAEIGMTHPHRHRHTHTHISCCPYHTERHWTFRGAGVPGVFVGQREKNWGSVEENTALA